MRPSFIKTVVAGAVLSRSPRLRSASTATAKDHANSLSVIPRLGSETNYPQAFRHGGGIRPACFRGRWQVISTIFRFDIYHFKVRCVKIQLPRYFDEFPELRGVPI